MAATAKKSKKSKWKPASITDIIAEPTTVPTLSWADSVDEEESYGCSVRPRVPLVALPSASRAARGGLAVDDESIPQRPPYVAHISNLPYDVDESAITDLFKGLKITSMRLPREGDRLRGYGYVEFEDRNSLIDAMNLPDLMLTNRRIRIEVSSNENDRRMGRGRSDRDREYDPERTMGDWRSGPRAVPEPQARRPDSGRTMDRDRDGSIDTRPGAWRDGDRPADPPRAPYAGRYSDDRSRGYDRGGFRPADRDGFNRDSRGFGSRSFGDRDRDPPKDDKPRERPKLNLLPRTVPREVEAPTKPADGADVERPAPAAPAAPPPAKPVPAEKVFGAAKPVDTSAKEREIEERLRKQEEEARRATDEKDRWGRREHSADRRSAPRRDDRSRDTRGFARDRRDYRDGDRRDYRDDKYRRDRYDYRADDRQGHARAGRDSRDGSRDRYRDRRDNSRGRRDSSGSRRDDSRSRRDDSRGRREDSRDRRHDSRDRRQDSRDRRSESRDKRDDASRDGSRGREGSRSSRDRYRYGRDDSADRQRDRKSSTRDDTNDRLDDAHAKHAQKIEDKNGVETDENGADLAEAAVPDIVTHEEKKHDSDDDRSGRRGSDGAQSRDASKGRDKAGEQRPLKERNGRAAEPRPLPTLKQQEKPNFVGSNKFSFLEDADDGGSD